MRDLFLFIPAYNVEKQLADLVNSIPPQVLLRTAEIYIIDDGSRDGTLQIARNLAAEEVRTSVRTESFEKNLGYGSVVKRGLLRAKELSQMLHVKYAVCLHGDGQYAAEAIPEMLDVLKASDAVMCQGSRLKESGNARKGKMPFYKWFGGRTLTFFENLVFKNKLTDRHSGLLAYKTQFLQTLDLNRFSGSFDIDFELLAVADSRGFRIAEISIPTRYADEKSNLNVISYGLRVLRIVIQKKLGKYD